MFHANGQRGSGPFATNFANLNIESHRRHRAVAKFLGVTEKTVKLWLSGKREPPNSAVAALWHETDEGRMYTHTHLSAGLHWTQQALNGANKQIKRLEAVIDTLEIELQQAKVARDAPALAANGPIWRV